MTECGGDDAKGMVNDNESVRSLGGRGMSRSIRDGICVCVVVGGSRRCGGVVVGGGVDCSNVGDGGGGVHGSGGKW